MKLNRRLLTLGWALVLGAGVVTNLPTAQAQNLQRVEQGGAVMVEGGGYCTVGFNEPSRRRSLVAAHCGPDGARVRIVDHNARVASPQLGTLYRSKAYDGRLGNDWAAIQWDAPVQIGGNQFSGDAWVNPNTIAVGERVCYFGQTSNRPTGAPTCGRFGGAEGNTFFVEAPMTRPGDSGGPLWIPGRGFVGVVSSQWVAQKVPLLGSRDLVVGVHATDGPRVAESRLLGLYAQNLMMPASGSAVGPAADAVRGAVTDGFSALAGFLPGVVNYS